MPIYLVLPLFLLLSPAASAQADRLAGRPAVIDARTLAFDGRRVRLAGITAPRPGETCPRGSRTFDCGRVAATALQDLFVGSSVECRLLGEREDGTELARCASAGYDLSEGMVYTGWARPNKTAPARYRQVERDARARRRGIWKGGHFPARVNTAAAK